MKKSLKRVIGFIIILHIIPCAFIVLTIFKHQLPEHGYLTPYLAGWVTNIVAGILYGISRFAIWCFDD